MLIINNVGFVSFLFELSITFENWYKQKIAKRDINAYIPIIRLLLLSLASSIPSERDAHTSNIILLLLYLMSKMLTFLLFCLYLISLVIFENYSKLKNFP